MTDKEPGQMTIEEIDAELTRMAADIPADSVLQLRKALNGFFDERKVPYSKDTLTAGLIMCNLIESTIPPMYAQAVTAARLTLYRLIAEEDSGLITSPVQIRK